MSVLAKGTKPRRDYRYYRHPKGDAMSQLYLKLVADDVNKIGDELCYRIADGYCDALFNLNVLHHFCPALIHVRLNDVRRTCGALKLIVFR